MLKDRGIHDVINAIPRDMIMIPYDMMWRYVWMQGNPISYKIQYKATEFDAVRSNRIEYTVPYDPL